MKKDNSNFKPTKDWLFSGILIFAIAIILEMLLFMYAQTDKVSAALVEDFKILLISEKDLSVNLEDVEKNIINVKGVKSVNFVSKKEQLAKLEETDPVLVSMAKTTGDNPLPDTWEVSIEDNAFFYLSDVETAGNIAYDLLRIDGINEFQYKKTEANALKHLFFYKRFSMMTLYFSGMMMIFFIFGVLIKEHFSKSGIGPFGKKDFVATFSGFVASILAFAVITCFLYPVSRDNVLWDWTSPFAQFLCAACSAMLSWGINRWKKLK